MSQRMSLAFSSGQALAPRAKVHIPTQCAGISNHEAAFDPGSRRACYSSDVYSLGKAYILEGNIMGLFDFAQSIGRKLFDNEADAKEKIREHIEQDNPGIKDLKVAYDDGVVSLSGSADDAAAMEKAVLMAGNVSGVAEVNAEALESPEAVEKVEYYVIEKGDTLSAIAKRYYGEASDYPRIFEANREVIKDPDLIFPGQKIRIPMDGG